MQVHTAPRRRRREVPAFSLSKGLVSLLMGVVFAFIAMMLFIIGYQVAFMGRIYPGVSAAGVDLGGMTSEDASLALLQELTYTQKGKILFSDKENYWMATPAELGMFFDPETTAKNAFAVGRRGSLFERLKEHFNARQGRVDLPPAYLLDQNTAYRYLMALAEQVDQPVIQASLNIQGTEVVVQPGQEGRSLDVEATLERLVNQVRSLQDGVVELVVLEDQPVVVDVSAQANLARTIISEPLVLRMPVGQPDNLGPWTFEPMALASMLSFEYVEDELGNTNYLVTINSTMLQGFLMNLAPELEITPENARFIFNDETSLLDLLQSAVIGRTLNVDGSIETIQRKLLDGEHDIELVLITTPPPVTDDMSGEMLGITELVHTETSFFYGSSAERIQNIQAAAENFHGLLVAPGETFSMAEHMGDITLDNGYAEALIIFGGQTITGVGGGVCQVSTTLFRAAFFTGFPIVERYPHAYRVGYYEKVAGNVRDNNLAGLDATVYVPIVDFKFINDTPFWLLMEVYVNPTYNSIQWKFYSTSDGRSVEWETTGPVNVVEAPDPLYRENPDLPSGDVVQLDYEADGAEVTIHRTVWRDNEAILQDTFYTKYEPWQAIYEYGPGTEGMPPSPEEETDEEEPE